VEWKWDWIASHGVFHRYLYGYWAVTWGVQVPLRCFAIARAASGQWGRKFLIIALGLNLIWFTAPQDVIYYFFWLGLYDVRVHYFDYLPPAGFWNLWNMVFVRVPLGVAAGAIIVRAGMSGKKMNWGIKSLVACALAAIGIYAVICGEMFFRM
jgi:hypothetical protein